VTNPFEAHLSAERLQAFLDGDLPAGERGPVEDHLAACARCSVELDAWRVLFADLSDLAAPAPPAGFADRIMHRVEILRPERAWLGSLFPATSEHVGGDVLQDLADGLVPARRVARIRAHLDSCPACTRELRDWQGVVRALGGLQRFAPREGFGAGVMAAVHARLSAPVRAQARAPVWATVGTRALVAARRFVPRTRRAWAALSGVAVTPAVIFGLMAYAVFSHPTLTIQSLASFAVWQLGDLFAAAWTALVNGAPGLASAPGAGSVLDLLAASPLLVAAGAIAYSAVAAIALRVLYKNLLGNRTHARLSTH
jgi:anti-sigma factor RsiW